MSISGRKSRILQQIVMLYTLHGDPVGSKLLNELLDEISVSSATIRNEMAELTSLGFLEQPHTSAGRVPTILGYRYYVDNLLEIKNLSQAEKKYIDNAVRDMDSDPDKAAEQAAKTLAELTDLAAIATTPKGGNVQITRFELVRSGKYNIAVLGITTIGGVRSRVCRVAQELSEKELAAVNSVINDHLVFVSPEDITPQLLSTANALLGNDSTLYMPVISAAVAIIKGASEVKVYAEGQQHLLTYQELDKSIKELLELFADNDAMSRRLDTNEPLHVFVGDEPGALGIDSLGVVMGRYRAAGGRHGALAVAGPIRMDYGFVIPRLSYFRDRVSDTLTNPIF